MAPRGPGSLGGIMSVRSKEVAPGAPKGPASAVSKGPAIRRLIPHRRFRPLSATIPIGRPGLYAGEPENCRRRAPEFLAVLRHLGLLLAVFHVYRVETPAFRILATVAAIALPAHYLAPYRWKKPLFVAVSIAGLF